MNPLLGQVSNSAGGYSYRVDDEVLLKRFLIFGTESGTYYSTEKELKRENVQCIDRLIMFNKGEQVVNIIRDISVSKRACKQNTAIFALAICARSNDAKTKNAAYRALSVVCTIPTHLFEFVKYCEGESSGTGWGRAHRTGIAKWYNNYDTDPKQLAMHVTKFRSRHSWSHKDVLRLSHAKPKSDAIGKVMKYIIRGFAAAKGEPIAMEDNDSVQEVLQFLEGVECAKKCKPGDIDKLRELIKDHKLVREHIPTTMLDSKEVWDSLLLNMPIIAMIRNLGKMSKLELLNTNSNGEDHVVKILKDLTKLKMVHPFTLFVAWYQYQAGRGEKGGLTWPVNERIVDALEEAFELAFRFVDPTRKRYLLAVDVSESMTAPVHGSTAISCRDASAAMMLLTAKTERECEIVAFSETLEKIVINRQDKLKTVIDKCSGIPFRRTDCSLPIRHAQEMQKKVDVFIVYTDSETFFGNVHPSTALQEYRKQSGINDARLIVVGMATNGFSIADPSDKFMLDVVGFDAEAPRAMATFINGNV